MLHNLANLSDEELAAAYGDLLALLRQRGIIRTKNLVGDLGEYLGIAHYNSRADLPKLQRAPTNTATIDAVSGATKYSIKSTTSTRTGAFHFPRNLTSDTFPQPPFDVVMVVRLNELYRLAQIVEFTWPVFLEVKRWSEPQKAWFIQLSQENLAKGRSVFGGRN